MLITEKNPWFYRDIPLCFIITCQQYTRNNKLSYRGEEEVLTPVISTNRISNLLVYLIVSIYLTIFLIYFIGVNFLSGIGRTVKTVIQNETYFKPDFHPFCILTR